MQLSATDQGRSWRLRARPSTARNKGRRESLADLHAIFVRNLKARLAELGKTQQKDIAAFLGVGKSTVTLWFKEEGVEGRQVFKLDEAEQIAAKVGRSAIELLGGKGVTFEQAIAVVGDAAGFDVTARKRKS